MLNSNAVVDQAFAALEETARIVRGQSSDVSKDAKKKNAAYWHAMLFSAVSKNPAKLQAVRQRLEQWIQDDMTTCVPIMLGKVITNTNKNSDSKPAASSAETTATTPTTPGTLLSNPEALIQQQQQIPKTKEQQIEEDIAAAFLVDEPAIERICQSYSAYKQIAFAATVIFEAVGSSSTGKLDITKIMMRGYRDRIFDQVRGTLFKYVAYHVTLCRRKEELLPSGGGLLRSACRMFATVAMQYDKPEDKKWFYEQTFVRRYHALALQEARRDIVEFLRQPAALDGLLTWAEDRIAFEMKLVDLFLHDDEQVGAAEVNNPFAGIRFKKQLQSVFIVPYLEDVLMHPSYGFAANLASGNWGRLKQQFSWSAAEKDRCPLAGDICTQALVDFVRIQLVAIITAFNEQVFESVAAAATSFVGSLLSLLKLVFTDLISGFADEGGAASLHRPVRKEFSRILSTATLKRKIGTTKTPSSSSSPINNEGTDEVYANLLCIYLDLVLRDPKYLPQGGGENDYPSFARNQVYDLFSVLEDRDIFGEHYRLRLSKRLLQTNWEEDNERAFLEVMQRLVGKLYTHKFEGMIFDVQGAQALQELFNNTSTSTSFTSAYVSANANDDGSTTTNKSNNNNNNIFEPKVLTAAYWPTLKRDDDFITPESLVEQIGIFERFYRKKFPTRQLKWQPERGTATLNISFPKGSREVSCSVYQAAVMLSIDDLASKNFSTSTSSSSKKSGVVLTELSAKTGIEMKELKPLVASMLLAKGLNLVRTVGDNPLNAKFGEGDSVEMNPDFTCKIRKIKLPSAITARSTASDNVGQSVIDASRAQMLDAAIVRIMKSRKEMVLKELVDLVINQVTKFFIPQPRDIKMRVEYLIQKEFLERDEDEHDLFRYLA